MITYVIYYKTKMQKVHWQKNQVLASLHKVKSSQQISRGGTSYPCNRVLLLYVSVMT